jgi:ArsR family transcriptional regulator
VIAGSGFKYNGIDYYFDSDKEHRNMSTKTDAIYESMAVVFGAMGNALRFGILLRLAERPHTVNEVARSVGGDPARVSHQLGLLKAARLVKRVRHGKMVIYSTDGPHVNRIIRLALEILVNISKRTCK